MEALLSTTQATSGAPTPVKAADDSASVVADFQALLQELLPSSDSSQTLPTPAPTTQVTKKKENAVDKPEVRTKKATPSDDAATPTLNVATPLVQSSDPSTEALPVRDIAFNIQAASGQDVLDSVVDTANTAVDEKISAPKSPAPTIQSQSTIQQQEVETAEMPPSSQLVTAVETPEPDSHSAGEGLPGVSLVSPKPSSRTPSVARPYPRPEGTATKVTSDRNHSVPPDHATPVTSALSTTPEQRKAPESKSHAAVVTPLNGQSEARDREVKADTPSTSSPQPAPASSLRISTEPVQSNPIAMPQPELATTKAQCPPQPAALQHSDPIPQIQTAELHRPSTTPELKVELKIEDFGRVQVSASMRDENVHALLKVESSEARSVISAEIDRTETSISRHEIKVQPFEAAANTDSQGSSAQPRQPQHASHSAATQSRRWTDPSPPILSALPRVPTSNTGLDLLA